MTGTRTAAWWRDSETVWLFARDLVRVDVLQDRDAVLDFFEKPHKWSVENLFWEEHERSDDVDVWASFDEWQEAQR